MQGIINILKPPGMTSFDVISYLRKTTGIKKIGHMGTLDPEAVGVLPICIGKATKAIEFLMEKKKVYVAEASFGVTTDTEDWVGTILEEKKILHSKEDVISTVNSFIGKYSQIPPMYSAIKIKGKKLYELARKGEEIERPHREVQIYKIDIKKASKEKALFEVECSKGTYIRTLCKDIGEKLGAGGHMSFLARTVVGNFKIEDSVTLEEIQLAKENGTLNKLLIDVEDSFMELDEIELSEKNVEKMLNGISLKLDIQKYQKNQLIRVYTHTRNFLGLAEITLKGDLASLKRKKIFID
jgi:tRNA pseudouridine55 synthase